jgi:hypothetical protein
MHMHCLDFRSSPRHPNRTTRAELYDLGAYLHWVWPTLPAPMVLEWSENPVVALKQSVPWIYAPVERDPLRDSRGASIVPRRVLARLKRIARLGVPFQRVAIAHELDPDGPVGHELKDLQSGPRACTDEEARTLVGKVPPDRVVARLLRVLDGAINGATFAARTLARRVLNQVIYGVVGSTAPRHGDLCLWYPLAAWRW